MSDSPAPDSPPLRTTGGNWRWEPPAPAELQEMLSGYSVEKLIGRGGMGAVYKGVQTNLDRPVAIKILPDDIDKADATYDERFRNEAKVMARLLHPAIVAVFDFGETPTGQLYFVMEYVDGTDIQGLISSQARLPADHALSIAAHVCDALTAAHALGIVHRDIKPSNVLINLQGQVKVADFGLAKLEEPGQHGLTQTGMALGTPDYVAPEALILGVNVDARADLYAVGVMLYLMLTGELPRGAWKAPSEKVPGLDPRFDAIVVKAMQTEPGERYQSSSDLRRDLDVILTVPFVKTDSLETAALPQQAVAKVPGQRCAAPRMVIRGNSSPKPEARRLGHTAPVTLPSKASGKKAAFWSIGIGAAALIVAGVFFAMKGREPSPDKLAAGSPAEEKQVAPVAPAPSEAATKIAPPKSNPSPSTKVADISQIGAYPAGLKVPVPDWLQKASIEGGRLEFIKSEGTPAEFDSFFDLGEAAKFDDFVWVNCASQSWTALRRNGNLYGLCWAPDKVSSFGPLPMRSISSQSIIHPYFLSTDGKILRAKSGNMNLFEDGDAPSGSRMILGYQGNSGPDMRTRVVLNENLEIIDFYTDRDELKPPPADFFQGSVAQAAMLRTYLALVPGEPLRTWRVDTGAPVAFGEPLTEVVEISAWGYEGLILREDGEAVAFHENGKLNTSAKPPTELSPSIRVRASDFKAAQKGDGTWMGWGAASSAYASISEKLPNLGPIVDFEAGSLASGDGDDRKGFPFLLTIRPKAAPRTETPSAELTSTPASISPDNGTTKSVTQPPPSSGTSEQLLTAGQLAQAKARGGKLRALGHGPNGPFDVGTAAAYDDFVEVTASNFGWAARRSGGQVYAGSWGDTASKPYIPLGPYETVFLSRAALINMVLIDGTSRNIWSDTSQQNGSAPAASDRVIAVKDHVFRLEADGKQHRSYGSSSPEKPDFFIGAPSITGTEHFFIRRRPGAPVQSWNPKSGTEFSFPGDTSDTVEMDGGQEHVILLTSKGIVQVWAADGLALEAEAPLRKQAPPDSEAFVAVRAGAGMSAAQRPDGSWAAWGDSEALAGQINGIGAALDLDLYHDDKASFAMWIEPLGGAQATSLTTVTPDLPTDVAKRMAEIDTQFQTAYDRDIAPGHEAAVAALDKSYTAAVKRGLDAATKAGNLAEAVRLREETRRLADKTSLPETDPEDLPDSLKKLRITYRKTIAKLEADRLATAQPYYDRRDQLLDAYQKELTRQKRLDDALMVKKLREESNARRGNEIPELVTATPLPAAAASTPTVEKPLPASNLKLPRWLEEAVEEGGKLRIWGSFEGKPIEEREAMKDFRESGYNQVMTGSGGLIFGMQRRGSGKRYLLDQSGPGKGLAEFRAIQAFDRNNQTWLADDFFFKNTSRSGPELDLWNIPIVSGGGDGHLIRLKSGEWISPGFHFNNPEDPTIKEALKTICDQLKADEAAVVDSGLNHVRWMTKDNRLRHFTISLRPGKATEVDVAVQPTEPIIQLINANDGVFGEWIALGASGAVYASKRGGFKTPIADIPAALALRYTAGGGFATLVVRKADGTWQAIGIDTKLNEFIAGIGPAIDLDVYAPEAGKNHRIVLWIEPRSGLQN